MTNLGCQLSKQTVLELSTVKTDNPELSTMKPEKPDMSTVKPDNPEMSTMKPDNRDLLTVKNPEMSTAKPEMSTVKPDNDELSTVKPENHKLSSVKLELPDNTVDSTNRRKSDLKKREINNPHNSAGIPELSETSTTDSTGIIGISLAIVL